MSDKPIVSINIVVLNGAKYARFCFDSILQQSYPHELIEVNVLDNGSTDETQKIIEEQGRLLIESGFSKFELIQSDKNLGMWPGQEELLKTSLGKYIVAAAIDIIYEKDFISNAVEILEANPKVGALQSKTYTFNIENGQPAQTKVIDTCGFEIQRSRRIVNIGHGQLDEGQFSQQQQIFAVEGACPILRRQAIDNIRINGQFIDPEYFWYGDDLDFAWRMTIFGWHQLFTPSVVAFHDRQTTKTTRTSWRDFIALRRVVPMRKRQLDWKNVRFTIIRNDYIMNILKDLPYILRRELSLLGYLAIYEFPVFLEIFSLLKRLPRLLRQRRKIMSRAAISSREFRKFIH